MRQEPARQQPASRAGRRLLIGLVILVASGLWLYSACTGMATADTLAADRAEIRTITSQIAPIINDAVDAEVVDGIGINGTYGEYDCSGAKTTFCRYTARWAVKATQQLTTEDFTRAFELAGFIITPPPSGSTAVTATRDGHRNGITLNVGTGDSRLSATLTGDDTRYSITLTSPSREMAPHQRPDLAGHEPLDLG